MVIPDVDKEMNEKSRVLIGTLALLMAVFIPGLGQAYNGEKDKAQGVFFVFMMLSFVIPLFLILVNQVGIALLSISGVILLSVYALIDAYIVAKTKK